MTDPSSEDMLKAIAAAGGFAFWDNPQDAVYDSLEDELMAWDAASDEAYEYAEGFASVKGAMEFCGLSERTIRQMLADGRLTPYRPIPGRVLISLEELEKLIRESRNQEGARGQHTKDRPPSGLDVLRMAQINQ